MRNGPMTADRRNAGFSLVELLIVVAIIMIMAAVALLNIGQYIRNYRIKAATQQVAGELQSARMKAISKNVNLGVAFAIVSATQYRYGIEDDLNPQGAAPHPWFAITTEGGGSWASLLNDPIQAGPQRTLPLGLVFDSPVNCRWPTNPGPAPTDWGLRFNRLGGMCRFANGSCGTTPPTPPAYTNYLAFNNVDSSFTVCLREISTNLRRAIHVSPGGRIVTQP